MRSRSTLALLFLAVSCATPSKGVDPEAASEVTGWFLSGPRQQSYRVTADHETKRSGRSSGRLDCVERDTSGAGTLMQSFSASGYRGKRVRFSAFVKTRGVSGWAGLWMRVDRPDGRSAFDNMQDRPLGGTRDWERHEVVLDVADDASALHIGLVQDGAGTSWIDDAALEIVGPDVETTERDTRPRALVGATFETVESPEGWHLGGIAREDFTASIDRTERHGGEASALLTPRVATPRGWAELAQDVRADDWREKRVRASAWVKGEGIERGGGFTAAVFAATSKQWSSGISFGTCAYTGTFDWKRCEVVLDVPRRGDTLEVSVSLQGEGSVWIDDVALEEVGRDVPLTYVDGRARASQNGDFEADGDEPRGWFLSGGARAHYEAIVDRDLAHGGRASARLAPRVAKPEGYGTLMQVFRAADYRGKRIRTRAHVKGRGITGRGDFWIRVQGLDAPSDGGGLVGSWRRFSGDFDWKPVEVVFDVPEAGDSIQLGVGLDHTGTLWLDDVTVEVVDASVPVTVDDQRPKAIADGGFEEGTDLPKGWFVSGGAAKEFDASVDRSEHASGRGSAKLGARAASPGGYGTLMTSLAADSYRGKRLRLNARVKGAGVEARGDLWLRVQAKDSPADGPGLGGGSCRLAGTFDWKPCTIVFDVPAQGESIQLGVGLGGPGTLWLDEVALEEVGPRVATTSEVRERVEPANLGFES